MPGVVGQPNQTYARTEFVNSTPPNSYALDQLRLEVENAGLSVALLAGEAAFSCTFTAVTLHFSGNLTANDVTTLDGIVAGHTGLGIVQLATEGPVVQHAPTGNATIGFESNAGTVDIDMSSVPTTDTVEYNVDADLVPIGTSQVVVVHGINLGATFQLKAINGFLNAVAAGGTLPLSSAMYSMIRVPGGWRIGQSPLP